MWLCTESRLKQFEVELKPYKFLFTFQSTQHISNCDVNKVEISELKVQLQSILITDGLLWFWRFESWSHSPVPLSFSQCMSIKPPCFSHLTASLCPVLLITSYTLQSPFFFLFFFWFLFLISLFFFLFLYQFFSLTTQIP